MAVMGARPVHATAIPARRRPRAPEPAPAGRSATPRPAAAHRAASRRRAEADGISGLLLAIAAAACVALFYLSQSTHVAATGYQIDELQAELSRVRAEQQQLILDISAARSPAELESQARRLGLQPLSEDRISFAQRSGASAEPAALTPVPSD